MSFKGFDGKPKTLKWMKGVRNHLATCDCEYGPLHLYRDSPHFRRARETIKAFVSSSDKVVDVTFVMTRCNGGNGLLPEHLLGPMTELQMQSEDQMSKDNANLSIELKKYVPKDCNIQLVSVHRAGYERRSVDTASYEYDYVTVQLTKV